MKKLGKKIIALVAVAVMGLSMIACGKKYSSVQAYVDSDEVRQVVKDYESEMQGTGMSISITADGDKMVYTYKLDTIEKADGMAEQMEAEMNKQTSTFQEAANDMKNVVKVDKPSVLIEYIDCNDELIYSKEFVAE